MAALPRVRNNQFPALYPLNRRCTYATHISQFRSGKEQRCKTRDCLMEFDLTYNGLLTADITLQKTLMANNRGMFGQVNSLTLDDITYDNLVSTRDNLEWVENAALRYDSVLNFVQTAPSTVPIVEATPGSPAVYPSIQGYTDIITQLPFASGIQYKTLSDKAASGNQQGYSYYGAGLMGFPTRGLKFWTLSHPRLLLAQATRIEQFFHWAWGRYKTFTFTDPDTATTYSNVRFANDVLEIRHIDFNHIDITVKLVEVFI